MGSQRVGHDSATSLALFTFMHWRRNGNLLQCSCLENPRGRGAWWAAVYGVARSWTRLKRLSSSSKTWKQPKCLLTEEWLKKIWYIGRIIAIKKNEIVPFSATQMDLEIVIQSEVKSDKDKYHMVSLICGI